MLLAELNQNIMRRFLFYLKRHAFNKIKIQMAGADQKSFLAEVGEYFTV